MFLPWLVQLPQGAAVARYVDWVHRSVAISNMLPASVAAAVVAAAAATVTTVTFATLTTFCWHVDVHAK